MRASGPPPECADDDGGAILAPPLLWDRLLDPAALAVLPARVRALRRHGRPCRYSGTVEVEHGRSIGARLIAACLRLPAAGAHALSVQIVSDGDGERWLRRFGDRPMNSRLGVRQGRLSECVGAAALDFGLTAEPDALRWNAEALRLGGIALPRRAFEVEAREFEQAGRYRFEVSIRLAPVGLLIAYAGSLDVE